MILVDYQIKQRIEDGTLGITPYNEDSINPNSYDLHLSNQFKYYINNGQMIDPYDRNTIIYGHEVVGRNVHNSTWNVCARCFTGDYFLTQEYLCCM